MYESCRAGPWSPRIAPETTALQTLRFRCVGQRVHRGATFTQLYLRTCFILFLSPPRGCPGEGPDCHFPKEIVGFGPIPARIRGEPHLVIFILALSAAGINVAVLWEVSRKAALPQVRLEPK